MNAIAIAVKGTLSAEIPNHSTTGIAIRSQSRRPIRWRGRSAAALVLLFLHGGNRISTLQRVVTPEVE